MTSNRGDTPLVSSSGTAAHRWLVEAPARHGIFLVDVDGDLATWPASAADLYGLEAGAVVGRPLTVLFADDDVEGSTTDDLLERARHDSAEIEAWHERADGSVFWASLSLSPVYDDGLQGYAAVTTDTTDRKRRERTLERQNDRLKEFTDILSHDLRSPLNVVDGRLDLYRDTGDEDHLEVMGETVDRMERLVEDLLRVAQQGRIVTDPEPTDVAEVVDRAWEGAGSSETATLETEDPGTVRASPDRLGELFENLFRNAIEHGGPDVRVHVGPLADGFYVEDTGGGIPADVRDDVFDHGFTTSDDGTGYGLSVVRTIVGAHGWDVAVTTGDRGGARFEITDVAFVG